MAKAAICSRRSTKNPSVPTITASSRCWPMVANAASISPALLASNLRVCSPSMRAAAATSAISVRLIRCARVGETADELAEQQPELVEGGNIHEQGDVATNFLLADLKPDVQKQNQFGRSRYGFEHMPALAANHHGKRNLECPLEEIRDRRHPTVENDVAGFR